MEHGCAVVYLSVMIIVQKTIGEFAHELMTELEKVQIILHVHACFALKANMVPVDTTVTSR